MNKNTINFLLIALASAGACTCGLSTQQAQALDLSQQNLLAQGSYQSNTAPPAAPSFLKQAGQKIFDTAQKKMLHNMNEKLNGPGPDSQTQTQTQQAPQLDANGQPITNSTSTVNPLTTVTPPAPRTAPPCRVWSDVNQKPIACLLCIHGLGLQSGSYEYFGQEQSRRGLAVYAIDVRGFGAWMKANGHTKVNFDDCLADIKQTLQSIRAANPGLPIYVLGESMGGAIALRAASMYPDLIDGLISSVPAGERFQQNKTSMKVFLNLVTGFNIANVGNDLVNQATQNAKLKSAWKDDPLSRLNLTPQELIQFQDFMNSNHDAAIKVASMPVLFVQGNGDQLVKPEGTWELFNDVASKDKSFFAVPGEHLIFEDAQTQDAGPRDQNFRVINSWLTAKVGRRRGGMYAGFPGGGGNWNGPGPGGGSTGGYGGSGGGWNGPGGSGGGYNTGGGYNGGGGYGGNNGGWNNMPIVSTAGLEPQVQLLNSGNYNDAINQLEQIRQQRPNDPGVLSLLGKAYMQSGQGDKAGWFFRRAMRMTRGGGDQANALNQYLLGLNNAAQVAPSSQASAPQSATAGTPAADGSPFAGFGKKLGDLVGLNSLLGGTAAGAAPMAGTTAFPTAAKGKVYAFYANWADQCQGMNDSLNKLAATYGNSVDIQRVDIENSTSDALVDQYKVGPIPTVVFIAPNGQVASTIIGQSSYNNYEQALRAISNQGRMQ